MKTIFHDLTLIMAAFSLACTSCGCSGNKESVPDVPVPGLSADVSRLEYTYEAGTQTVNIISASRPNLVSSASWCTAKSVADANDAYDFEVIVSVQENTSEEEREAVLSVVSGSERLRIDVVQSAKPAEPGPLPEDFLQELTPGTNNAWRLAEKLGMGWNLGNQLDAQNNGVAAETAWGNKPATQATFDGLKAKGFTSVRIPVTWLGHIGDAPDYKIDEAWLDRVAEVVGYAGKSGLNAIINIHHDGADSKYWLNIKEAAASDAGYEKVTAEFRAVWKQIAGRFKNEGDWLIFEPFNEIHDGKWGWGDNLTDGGRQYNVINKWNQEFVDIVRASGGNNAERYLGIPGYCTNPKLTIENLVLPEDTADGKLMVAVHCYDPNSYTLEAQYDEWGHTAKNNPYVSETYGLESEKEIISVMSSLKSKYIDNNIPVYFGESGCVNRDTARKTLFQKYYLEFFFRAARNYGMAAFLWDNGDKASGRESSGFVDHATGEYIVDGKTMVEAMKKAVFTYSDSYTLKSVYQQAPK